MTENMKDIKTMTESIAPLTSSCFWVQEDHEPAFPIGNAGLAKNPIVKDVLQEETNRPGLVCAGTSTEGQTYACFIKKEELHKLAGEEQPVEKTKVLPMFLKLANTGIEKLQAHAAGIIETTKHFAQKAALVTAIVGSGLLAPQIADAQNISAGFSIPGITQPASKTLLADHFVQDNPYLQSYEHFFDPVHESLRSTLVRLSGRESGGALSIFGFDTDKYAQDRVRKYRDGNIEGWKEDGKAFQQAYLSILELDKRIAPIISACSIDEMQMLVQQGGTKDPSTQFLARLLQEKQTLNRWMRTDEGGNIPYSAVLEILSPDGKTLNLSRDENQSLALNAAKMNTEEQRAEYFQKHPMPQHEQNLTMLAVDMIQRLETCATLKDQQAVFTAYKKAELIERFQQTVILGLEDKKPDAVWQSVALFSKNVGETQKALADKACSGLVPPEAQNKPMLDQMFTFGQELLGARGLEGGLTAKEMTVVLNNLDLSPLKQISAADTQNEQTLADNTPKKSRGMKM